MTTVMPAPGVSIFPSQCPAIAGSAAALLDGIFLIELEPEGRFRKHFRKAPPETWHDDMLPLAEFIGLEEDDRDGKFPFIE